jgi:hypothetical protein
MGFVTNNLPPGDDDDPDDMLDDDDDDDHDDDDVELLQCFGDFQSFFQLPVVALRFSFLGWRAEFFSGRLPLPSR